MGYENLYEGGDSNLDPDRDRIYTGAVAPQGQIGGSTSVQTANQIIEVNNMLNTGMKTVEVSTINADVLEMIPKQHLTEINRLTKLTGSDVSMHAPVIDPSGFISQQGWDEQNREQVERQFGNILEKAHELRPDGNIPVTFHSSQIPGTEHMPIDKIIIMDDKTRKALLRDHKDGLIPTKIIAVNQETGQFVPMIHEIKQYPTGEHVWTSQAQLDNVNSSEWINKLTNLAFYKKEADESMAQKISNDPHRAELFLQNVDQSFRSFFDKSYQYSSGETKKALDEIRKDWQNYEKDLNKIYSSTEADPQEVAKLVSLTRSKLLDKSIGELVELSEGQNRKKFEAPAFYKKVEDFAIDKASETFSGAALHAYKKFGENTPIISVENPPYGTAVSTGQDLANLVKASRTKFAEKLVNSEGLSESEANKVAKKLIGATWDTSHISMIRKQGFGKEQLIEEAEKIAPYVKHIHLNDNFGHTHTDLPPGMGDVPFKEIMAKINKENPDAKKIFEGGNFFQHFKSSPHPLVLQGMGSPLYSMAPQPSWHNIYGTFGTYSSGYGPFLTDTNFATYGSGFSLASLPEELGGQVPGRQSRFSGSPMS